MKFYKDSTTGKWMLGTREGIPAGTCLYNYDSATELIEIEYASDRTIFARLPYSEFLKENGDAYASKAEFDLATADFFVKTAGGISSGIEVIDALGYVPADEADLNAEITARQNADVTLQNQINGFVNPLTGIGELGQINIANTLIIACGDSITETINANQSGSSAIAEMRELGGIWGKLKGFVNFGGSGNTIYNFVNAPLSSLPVVDPVNNLGINGWDYYGHKPIGAVSLATALAWRSNKTEDIIWNICFGANDVILYHTQGNLTQTDLTTYIYNYLVQITTTIKNLYPNDSIIFSPPNPFYARPYTNLPLPSEYPTFGTDLTSDSSLIEKWNQGIRNAYLKIRNKYTRVLVFDVWEQVFGNSTPSVTVGSLTPFMNDNIHPSGQGTISKIKQLAVFINDNKKKVYDARKTEAVMYAANTSTNVWDRYPLFFKDNQDYILIGEFTTSIGSSYIDIYTALANFKRQIIGNVYIVAGDGAAQKFNGTNAVAQSTYVRLLCTPTALMQQATGTVCQFYVDKSQVTDSYITLASLTARKVYNCSTNSAGNGYMDIGISAINGRFSTNFMEGIKNASLLIGGTACITKSFSGVNIDKIGQHLIRVYFSGDNSPYSGQPIAIIIGSDTPLLESYEFYIPEVAFLTHAQTNKTELCVRRAYPRGGVFSIKTAETNAVNIVVEIYTVTFNSKVLLGTMTINATTSNTTLVTGNPASITAFSWYEFVVTSATTGATPLMCILTPNA